MAQDRRDLPAAQCQAGLLPLDGVFTSVPPWRTTSRTCFLTRLGRISASITIDPLEIIEQEPDAGLGNGGLGRLAACFLDSMATLAIPGMGYGLRYEYGIFRQTISDGWQIEQPDHWLARPDPWEVPRPDEAVEVKLNCSFEIRGGALRVVEGRPSSLIGIPFDRPVVGYGGQTINTLRLWAAKTPDYFDFARFSSGDFVGALAETLTAETFTRVLYPDDSHDAGQGSAIPAGIFPRRLLAGRPRPSFPRRRQSIGRRSRTRSPSSSTTRIRPWPCRS